MFLDRLPGKVVSATAFVRNFGSYARTVANEPIHILNHGRPAWSLIATDQFEKLANGAAGGGDQERLGLSRILDSVSAHVTILDGDLNIVRMNVPVRHALLREEDEVRGRPIAAVLSDARYAFILRAIERVQRTAIRETLEIDIDGEPPRIFQVLIERHGDGVILLSEEITAAVLIRKRHAIADAYEELMDSLPGLARGTINARGVITSASPAMAELVQSDPERIRGMRLSSLIHTSGRTAVADAIEEMLSRQTPFSIPAPLQAGGIEPVPVMLSAASHPVPRRDEGGIFLVKRGIASDD